jgi:predicted nucleic acid-binding protein
VVLVDTSVWITHFRQGNSRLRELILEGDVLSHPLIVGELACGYLKNRSEILELLQSLPRCESISLEEGLAFLELHALPGKGIGWIDVNLLASAMLSKVPLWTEDKRLQAFAARFHLAF